MDEEDRQALHDARASDGDRLVYLVSKYREELVEFDQQVLNRIQRLRETTGLEQYTLEQACEHFAGVNIRNLFCVCVCVFFFNFVLVVFLFVLTIWVRCVVFFRQFYGFFFVLYLHRRVATHGQ